MRDPARIDKVLEAIKVCWEMYPDWRFCQLMCNLNINDKFYLEDEDFIVQLNKYVEAINDYNLENNKTQSFIEEFSEAFLEYNGDCLNDR